MKKFIAGLLAGIIIIFILVAINSCSSTPKESISPNPSPTSTPNEYEIWQQELQQNQQTKKDEINFFCNNHQGVLVDDDTPLNYSFTIDFQDKLINQKCSIVADNIDILRISDKPVLKLNTNHFICFLDIDDQMYNKIRNLTDKNSLGAIAYVNIDKLRLIDFSVSAESDYSGDEDEPFDDSDLGLYIDLSSASDQYFIHGIVMDFAYL